MMIPIIVVALIVLFVVFNYNSLVRNKNRAEEAWADIEVQLKRRYDLIPNLVSTVKGYAAHESTAFEKVTEARAHAIEGKTLGERATAEGALGAAMTGIFGIAEAYPELKANTNFLALQSELSDTENKIQSARRFYNGNVRDYNTKLEVFPTNIFAKSFGFTKKEFFDLPDTDAAQQPVQVAF